MFLSRVVLFWGHSFPPTLGKTWKYRHPDIDVYLYGLDSVRANEKLEHIYNVWKSNLPHDDAQVIVIAFFSAYPTKRVQIILKLVRNPKEVLLNFDLDVCAMG